jgi:uncharacterized membrane-anchored protein YitT (DUF2179 family)
MGAVAAIWGVLGVFLLIGSAVYRLIPIAVDALTQSLAWYHWTTLLLWLLFMLYSEGYRGFQLGFSPSVAARARYLKDHPRFWHVLFAPLFCMGYFHATKRRRRTSILVTLMIVIFVVLIHQLVQPWRGIVDVGVVAGLVWGLGSLVVSSYLAFTSEGFDYSPEIPAGPPDQAS